MSVRELIVLGTASQVPTAYRSHNGFFLRWDGEGILFDPGEGTQRQMIRAGVAATDITRICITHFHGDHSLGLAGVIQRISLDSVPHVIPVHYPASGQVYFDRLRRSTVFAHRERLEPRPVEAGGVIHEDEHLLLIAEALEHGIDCFGYRVQERSAMRFRPELLEAAGLRGPIVGRLQREGVVEWQGRDVHLHDVTEIRPRQAFAFVMDTGVCENAVRLAGGADLVVCESTFLSSEQDLAREAFHLTAADAGRIARDAGARRLVLGHFSQRYDDDEPFLVEAQAIHEDVVLAREPLEGDPQGTRHRVPVPRRRDAAFVGDFEAHLTVTESDDADFEAVCRELGVKPILIELARGSFPRQPMTSSHHQGELPRVRAVVEGLADRIRAAGFEVLRVKIEADADTDGVPLTEEAARRLPNTNYFEYHVRVRTPPADVSRLEACCVAQGAHLSRNAFRRCEDGAEERYATARVPGVGKAAAEARREALVEAIRALGLEIVAERREFTVYDSNLDLDRGWLPA